MNVFAAVLPEFDTHQFHHISQEWEIESAKPSLLLTLAPYNVTSIHSYSYSVSVEPIQR